MTTSATPAPVHVPTIPGTPSRRSFLGLGLGMGLTIAGGGVLTGCAPSPVEGDGKPRRGGVLRVGVISGGTAETLNPGLVLTTPDGLRSYALFDRLFEQYDDLRTLRPGLAVEAVGNAAANVWTLRLREGVTWHDGKPFTADDVVWTFKSWSDPRSYANQFFAGLVDFDNVRKRGPLAVEVPLVTPVAQFPSLLTFYNMGVVQDGATKFAQPVGTGPFRFESFTPGRQSVFSANREYWADPYPYVDKLVIDSSFTDETPRLNALLSGAINVLPLAPPTIAKGYLDSSQLSVLRAPSPINLLFTMRVDRGTFADVRIRQALRLCIDREEMTDVALSGFGSPSSDLLGLGCDYFADDLKREQDIDQARFLLKQAGAEGLAFTLPTANVAPGYVESATLFAQQAKAAGVTIKVRTASPSNYFGGDYLTRAIGQDQSLSAPSLTQHYRTFFAQNGGYNTTHWGDQPGGAAAQRLLREAIGATNPTRAAELWREVQQQQFDAGGQIAFCAQDSVDLVGSAVRGLKAGPGPTLNNWRLLTGWVAT